MEKLEPLFMKLARVVNNWETILVIKGTKTVNFKDLLDVEKAIYIRAWIAPYVESPISVESSVTEP